MSVTFYILNDETEVNISNSSAVEILDMLGYKVGESFEDRCCGSLTVEDFLGRVLIASALLPEDAGIPTHSMSHNFVECGRPEGYLNQRCADLQELGEKAQESGSIIYWS